ncbi:MAG: ATP phosphoribosyltransferase [Anaerolineae bacterium]|nr:ATP phosphoribosyltransferase [Anaerolineae bacterium]
MTERIILALPGKGALAEPSEAFLKDCGLKVNRLNPRQYTGTIAALPGVEVLYQRVNDIVYKVADGTAALGITGLDVVQEHPHDDLVIVHDRLGYGHCDLVVAVPEAWVDVESMADLTEIALDFREQKGRNLRIATKYTHLTRQFLRRHHIHHFTLVDAEGAIEAAPTIGYADIIIDLTQTGTTLRENHLKQIKDGTIILSQACLIGNRRALQQPAALEAARILCEYMDAALNGRSYYQLNVDICGDSAEAVAALVVQHPLTRGLLGPTVAPIYGTGAAGTWYTVTIGVSNKNLLAAIEHLRSIGGRNATALPVRYIFHEESQTFVHLRDRLTRPG